MASASCYLVPFQWGKKCDKATFFLKFGMLTFCLDLEITSLDSLVLQNWYMSPTQIHSAIYVL